MDHPKEEVTPKGQPTVKIAESGVLAERRRGVDARAAPAGARIRTSPPGLRIPHHARIRASSPELRSPAEAAAVGTITATLDRPPLRPSAEAGQCRGRCAHHSPYKPWRSRPVMPWGSRRSRRI